MAKILIVDDSPSIQQLVKNTLESVGHNVDSASDAPQALRLSSRHAYDLILTDIQMPPMDGYMLTSLLRQRPRYSLTPIVVLSSLRGSKEMARGKAAGASAWITKPVEPDLLVSTVEQLLA